MLVTDLKEYIYENKKIEYVLQNIGCNNIVYHQNKDYYSCSNYDGDNKNAINIKNNKYLSCVNYTRKMDENSDLISLVEYNKKISFIEAIKYLHKILDLSYTHTSIKKEEKHTENKALDMFRSIRRKSKSTNIIDYTVLDEDSYSYLPFIHIDFFKRGIIKKTIDKFGLCYSYKRQRSCIPLRYWLDGSLLGWNMRTSLKNYEELNIPKYITTEDYPKNINLYGLYENYKDIINAGYVIVYESEASVLVRDSLNDSTGVALSSHNLSDEQVRILIGLNVEIIIAMDNDIELQQVREMCEKFYGVRKVSYIWDRWKLIPEKSCCADCKNKIFNFLFKYRTNYDYLEHKMCLENR